MSGCGHSMVTVSRSSRAGATTYVESPSVTVNGAGTVRITGSPLVSVGPARASASKYGWKLPSRIGGSGPVSSTTRSSISWAAIAASTCSTVWMVVSPLPIAVRRSTASTSDNRAGTSGFPARSTRRNTIPCPAGAGRNVASVRAPVCSPVPDTAAFDVRAARDPRLAGDETAGADAAVVPDLHEVVDLRPRADDGVVHAAPVDGGIRADLDVVADDAASDLGHFARQLAALPRDVAEPIRPEPHAGVQDDPVSHHRPAVAHYVGQQLHVVTQLDAVAQHAPGADPHVPTQPHAATQHHVGADGHGLLPHDPRADHGGPVDPGLPCGLGIEHRDDREQRHVRIAHQHAA